MGKDIIDRIRVCVSGSVYYNSMSPIVASQVLTVFKILNGEIHPGLSEQKLDQLISNSRYFRAGLEKIGLHLYGDDDSPVIPMLVYFPGKLAAFSRECLKRGLAVVVVGFPATPVILSRARYCVSASHTKEDIDQALEIIGDVAEIVGIKYAKNGLGFESI